MPYGREVPDEVRDAIRRIGAAIDKELGVIGPASPWALGMYDDDDVPPTEGVGVMLGDWVLVYASEEPDTGEVWCSFANSLGLPEYRRQGLLRSQAS